MRFSQFVQLSVLCLLLTFASLSSAIDVAIPSDFFAYEVIDNDPSNEGYYLSAGITHTASPETVKPYAFMLDARGELVWFHTDYDHEDLRPFICPDDRMVIHSTTIKEPSYGIVLDSDYAIIDSVHKWNPYHENMYIDGHEALYDADGTLWTQWLDPGIVDMSQYVEGGQTECLVEHAAIQQWDADGNLLWEWRSGEHLDGVPYTERVDQASLLFGGFRHLHINSFQILDDGNILVSARKMDTVFLIERETGDVLWHVGAGPANDFEFISDFPDVHADFCLQHDGHLYPGDRLTVYDNAGRYLPLESRGREYQLDYDEMTATLLWYYEHPEDIYGDITGSCRILPNNNRLICWGGSRRPQGIPTNATEVTAENEIVWELTMYQYPQPTGRVPATYRVVKLEEFNPAAEPYLSKVSHWDDQWIELVCNWFGHEDEVDGYRVFGGLNPDNLQYLGLSDDGFYLVENIDPLITYYFAVQPVDDQNEPVGPPSNLLATSAARSGLELSPIHTNIPGEGGYLLYSATVTSVEDYRIRRLYLATEVVLPDGEVQGPLEVVPLCMEPNSLKTFSNLHQRVPDYAPPGTYEFIANLYSGNGTLKSRDSFSFTKAVGGDYTGVGPWNEDEWGNSGQISDDESLPAEFELTAAYPNPFNALTVIEVKLPVRSELTVAVYNVLGQQVASLANGLHAAGTHNLTFDASGMASGLYFVRATVPGQLDAVQKVMLVR
jgi:Arylsulfotransferase (ASST)/Secretion system C-terminal sorting domain